MLLNITTNFNEITLKKNKVDEAICLTINNDNYYVAIATVGNSFFANKLEFKINESLMPTIMALCDRKKTQQMWKLSLMVDNGVKDTGKGGYLFDGFAFILHDVELTEEENEKLTITGYCADALLIGNVCGKDGNLLDYGKSYRIKLENDFGSTAICPFIEKGIYNSVIAKEKDICRKHVHFNFNIFRKKDSFNYEMAITELSFSKDHYDVNSFVAMLNNSNQEDEDLSNGLVSDDDLPF